MRVTEMGTPQTLEQHILIPMLVYVYYSEMGLYYGGEQAMILPWLVPFFLLGLFTTLYYWRSPGLLILLWVVLTSMGNMLLTEAALYARYVVAFPAVALLIAVGLRTIGWLVWPSRWRIHPAVWIVLLMLMAGEQVRYYFGPHLTRYNQQTRQTFDSEDAIFRSLGFPMWTQIYVLTANNPGEAYLTGILNYLVDGLRVQVMPEGGVTAAYLNELPRGDDMAFFVEPGDTFTVELLRRYFVLEGPFFTPYDIEPERALLLYYSPYGSPPPPVD
jgi:hypothetical protein